MTLQALSESNRRLWLEAMDGKEPVRKASFLFCAKFLLTLIFRKRTTSCCSYPLQINYNVCVLSRFTTCLPS